MSYILEHLENSKLVLHNRLVMPPMATSRSGIDGAISKELIDYFLGCTKRIFVLFTEIF